MNKFLSLFCGCALLLLGHNSCSQAPEAVQEWMAASPQQITVTATLPASSDSAQKARAVVQHATGTLKLTTKWQTGDRVNVIMEQNGKLVRANFTTVRDVSTDGKRCHFTLEVPQGIDAQKPIKVYGACGSAGARRFDSRDRFLVRFAFSLSPEAFEPFGVEKEGERLFPFCSSH